MTITTIGCLRRLVLVIFAWTCVAQKAWDVKRCSSGVPHWVVMALTSNSDRPHDQIESNAAADERCQSGRDASAPSDEPNSDGAPLDVPHISIDDWASLRQQLWAGMPTVISGGDSVNATAWEAQRQQITKARAAALVSDWGCTDQSCSQGVHVCQGGSGASSERTNNPGCERAAVPPNAILPLFQAAAISLEAQRR